MKYVIELPEYIKHEVDIEEDVDKAEDFIKWYSATLTCAIKDSTPLQAEFDLDKMADRVAEKALDEFTYNGKTIREWVEIIVAQDLLAITELEKIKTELQSPEEIGFDFFDGLDYAERVIDNRIAALKGDDNK